MVWLANVIECQEGSGFPEIKRLWLCRNNKWASVYSFALNKLLFTKDPDLKWLSIWMTPILLPFPEDSDGLLTFKNYSSPPASFPKTQTLWKRLNFWWFTGAKLVIQRLANCTWWRRIQSRPHQIRVNGKSHVRSIGSKCTQTRVTRNPDGPVKLAEYWGEAIKPTIPPCFSRTSICLMPYLATGT